MNRYAYKTFKFVTCGIGLTLLAALAACNGGGNGSPAPGTVATANVTAPVNAATVAALIPAAGAAPVVTTFNSGFSGVDATGAPANITGATTVSFAAGATPAAAPVFNISNGGNTASGPTTFGSCIFTVTSSTFPATSPLAVGNVVKVDPCSVTVSTSGAHADGVAAQTNVAMVFGSTTSAQAFLPVVINTNGSVIIGNTTIGTVVLTPVTGGSS